MIRSVLALLLAIPISSCGSQRTDPASIAENSDPSAAHNSAATPEPSGPFDAAAWLRRAREVSNITKDANTYDPLASSGAIQLLDELDSATGWKQACFTSWDSIENREIVTPDSDQFERDTYWITDIDPDQIVIEIPCIPGAYQGESVLIHVSGNQVALLKAPVVDYEGEPFGPASPLYFLPELEPGSRDFATFAKGRSLGSCGAMSSYRVATLGVATLLEVRARECDFDSDFVDPEDWPVVYPHP